MCTFNMSDIQKVNSTCSDDGRYLSIQVIMAYSSVSGAITASDMIEIFRDWVRDNPSMVFIPGGTNTLAVQVCTPMCTTNQTEQPPPKQGGDSDIPAIIGALLGGLLAGMALIAVPAVIFILW